MKRTWMLLLILSLVSVTAVVWAGTNNAGHPDSSTITGTTLTTTDSGGWVYDNNTTDSNWGRVLVSCSHSDSRGSAWTSY
jgi:hypothetical protein